MIRVETHFAGELVALGSVHRDADDPGWGRTCMTAAEEALSFPRRSFVVTPGYRRATPTVLHAGMVSFARPSVEYRRERVDPLGEEGDWLWLRADLRAELGLEPGSGAWNRRLHPSQFLRQRRLHAWARRAAEGAPVTPVDALEVETLALELVSDLRLAESVPEERLSGRCRAQRRIRIQRVIEALAAEPRRRRSTAELAQLAGLSPSHFCVAFRRETGRTVGEVWSSLRLCVALDRLGLGRGDLTDLALELGFSSHAHFTARFRRHFGCTPSVARTRLNAGMAPNVER